MKQILVISGKGGTGKTVLTASFAVLAESKVVADCDVDAADLYLLLHPVIKERNVFQSGQTAVIDKNICVSCGKCMDFCRFQAITQDFTIDPIACEGCALCKHICPVGAIHMQDNNSGEWFVSDTKYGTLVHAELGIAEDTIVFYSTDNGPHMNTWPDGAMTPFRNEKNSNWEGAFRVPGVVRWSGKIPAGIVSNEIVAHQDWLPTFLAAAGDPDIKEKLKDGLQVGDKQFKVHIDGYDLLSFLTMEGVKSPRPGFMYFSDDGDMVGLRYDNWKVVFMEQRYPGTLQIWAEPFVKLRFPKMFNLRTDPFERADVTSNTYWDWVLDHVYLMYAAQGLVKDFMATFVEFPPRMKPASFTVDQASKKLEDSARSH